MALNPEMTEEVKTRLEGLQGRVVFLQGEIDKLNVIRAGIQEGLRIAKAVRAEYVRARDTL